MINIFFDIAVIIIAASFLGYIARSLKQPLVLSYILAGLIIGPRVLGWVSSHENILLLSELGIAFLLFIVGLEFDFGKLKEVGWVSFAAGITQIIVSFILGYIIAFWFGFDPLSVIYLALALTFSSTMIVVKLLTDRNELSTLHGRIILVTLLIQDIAAIFAISFLSALSSISVQFVLLSLFKAGLLFLMAYISNKLFLPTIFRKIADSAQLLFLCSLAWLFFFSSVAYLMGFSLAIGAFLAGISLAGLPYSLEIISRVRPLSSFFATIFFAALGMQFVFGDLTNNIFPIISFILLVGILNPLSIMIPVSMFGYKNKTSFLSGIAIGQTSEFSLIIVSMGLALGHISGEIVSIIVFITAVTIMLTTYLVKYSNPIYYQFSGILSILDNLSKKHKKLEYLTGKGDYEVILCGHNRIGYSILQELGKMKKKTLVIDYNPDMIRQLMRKKINCIYGDVGDLELLDRINFESARLLVSTVPALKDNLLLIKRVKDSSENAIIFVTASEIDEALKLYDSGADYVILPHFLGGDYVSLLLNGIDKKRLMKIKTDHLKELLKRQRFGHEHPKHN